MYLLTSYYLGSVVFGGMMNLTVPMDIRVGSLCFLGANPLS
jgi:hypothetical protein